MSRRSHIIRVLAALAVLAGVLLPVTGAASSPSGPAGLHQALEAQAEHTARLFQDAHVVGTAVGVDGDVATLVVLAERPTPVPRQLDGVAVTLKVTGPLTALHHRSGHIGGPGGGGDDGGGDGGGTTTSGVAVGDSTGNALECASGTIAATFSTSGGTPVFLSNNHVFARENHASLGETIVSPGRYDVSCGSSTPVAKLSKFEAISFSSDNRVDAAIAAVDSGVAYSNSAPSYGAVSTSTQAPSVGLAVEKHGRTSGHTTGQITAVNATIRVGYSGGTATFVGQVIVESNKPFIKSGDSGSLLVSRSGNHQVGLLFAGNSSGKLGVANQIGDVYSALGLSGLAP